MFRCYLILVYCLSNLSRLVVVYMPSDNENSSLKRRWRKTIKILRLSFRHRPFAHRSRPSLRSHSANFGIEKENTGRIVSMASIWVRPLLHLIISTSRLTTRLPSAECRDNCSIPPHIMLTFIGESAINGQSRDRGPFETTFRATRCYLWYFIGISKTPALQSD